MKISPMCPVGVGVSSSFPEHSILSIEHAGHSFFIIVDERFKYPCNVKRHLNNPDLLDWYDVKEPDSPVESEIDDF